MKFKEILDPIWLMKNDWHSTYQLRDNFEVRNHPKKYMVTKREDTAPLERIIKKLTKGVQAQYLDVNNGAIDYKYTFTNGRAYNFDDSIENLALSIYYGSRHPAIIFTQIMEDSNIHGSSDMDQFSRWSKTLAIIRRLSELYWERDGIPIEDNWNFGDYFAPVYGANGSIKMDQIGYAKSIDHVKSQDEAKKTNTNERGEFVINQYEAQRMFDFQHKIIPGYIEGLASQFRGVGLYSCVYDIFQNYMQRDDRKLMCYASGTVEGLGFPGTDRAGINVRFPITGTNYDLMRLSPMEGNYKLSKAYSALHLLFSQGICLWDDNAMYGLNDKNFGLAYYGGEADWKTTIQEGNGEIVKYDPNKHPKPDKTGTSFATNHAPHNNGSFAGNVLYGEIWDRCNRSLQWANFSYRQNGLSYSGYKDGDKPQIGELGNAEVSRLGMANIGDANAAHQWFNGKRDMLWRGEGDAGIVYVGYGVKAGFAGTTTYKVPEGEFTRRSNGFFAFIPE